jgi:lantibiotic biosynthesis protein
MNKHYHFHEKLVLRTPRLPLSPTPNEESLKQLIQDDGFLEAIYLASPVLHEECIKWREGKIALQKDIQKIGRSLIKYYTRMTSRSTPFGLFSGCSVVPWIDDPTHLEVSSRETRRHTRLDMHYLCALAQKMATMPGIRESLVYYRNNSIYSIGEEIRYVEYTYIQARRTHQISSVTRSGYLSAVLDKADGVAYDELVRQLVGDDINEEEATAFINELIAAQLLISELEPAITGPEFIYQLIAALKKANGGGNEGEGGEGGGNEGLRNEGITYIIAILEEAVRLLKDIDRQGTNNAEKYRRVMELLDKLEASYEESKLFQTDLVRVTNSGGVRRGGVHNGLREQLAESLTVLNKLSAPAEHASLQSFMRRFSERYEDKEMPLLEVLDTETGIGYLEKNGDIAPLVEDLQVQGKTAETRIPWNVLEQYLSAKLQEASKDHLYAITIQDGELEGLTSNWDDLPPSMSVLFRMTGENDHEIYLEGAGGSSAANLLGRFAHADPGMHELIMGITGVEQANDPGIVYAEIVHLPESRIGNILLHPSFRAYEIPYLAKSSVADEFRLELSDLFVSVRNGRVILRSRRLNREIVPRLTTSHNFSYNALPVYQLLCDLQIQGKRGALGFHWGSLGFQHKFLPRVMYKGTILSPATWSLQKKDVDELLTISQDGVKASPDGLSGGMPGGLSDAIAAFRTKWGLPRYAALADGDNELLVDFDSGPMVLTWLEAIKTRAGFVFKEFFHRRRGPVADEQGRPYANQLVAILIKNGGAYAAQIPIVLSPAANVPAGLQRKFSPGSEWLYYKVYCGIRSSDKILLEAIKPLAEELLQKGLISQWFFIRYTDPGTHIRLRFRMVDPLAMGEVISGIRTHLSPFETDGYIWKLQLDTYNREIERYGMHTIEAAENFFYHDSVAVLKMLDNTWGDERETLRWAWGMRSIDELLNAFGFGCIEKLELLGLLKDAFAREFNSGKPLRQQLTDKYRTHRQLIETMMNPDLDPGHEIYPLIAVLTEKSMSLRSCFADIMRTQEEGRLEMPLRDLVGSFIHMLLNRLTTSNPRLHEMVIYDFLFRHYQSLAARQKIALGGKRQTEMIAEALEPITSNY